MTDDLQGAELDLPVFPDDFTQLRAILLRVPRPVPPQQRSARVPADLTAGTPIADLAGVGLVGEAPGFLSGASIGVYPTLLPYNLLEDPRWQRIAGTILTGSEQDLTGDASGAWFGLTTSGSFTTRSVFQSGSALDAQSASKVLQIWLRASGASTMSALIRSADYTLGTSAPPQVFLTAAVRVFQYTTLSASNVTSATVTIELYDVTSAVVRASQSLVVSPNTAYGTTITASYPPQASEYGHTFELRIKWDVVASGANTQDQRLWLVEPRLAWTPTVDAPVYTPAIASWIPDFVYGLDFGSIGGREVLIGQLSTEAFPRIVIWNDGRIDTGDGTAAPITRMDPGGDSIRKGVEAKGTGSTTLTTSNQKLQLDSVVQGDNAILNNGNDSLDLPNSPEYDGTYRISWTVETSTALAGTTNFYVSLQINGVEHNGLSGWQPMTASSAASCHKCAMVELLATDVVTIHARAGAGVSGGAAIVRSLALVREAQVLA